MKNLLIGLVALAWSAGVPSALAGPSSPGSQPEHHQDGDATQYNESSHPGLGVESLYSQAVLAYDRHETAQALGFLDQVLAQEPDHVQALELKALVLKSESKDRAALSIYRHLHRLKPPRERGPYDFEIGVILNHLGASARAIGYFEASVRLGFNLSASHLFLGMLRFNSGGDPKKAEADFAEVLREGLPEMKVVAHYYLGLIQLKEGYAAQGVLELNQAKELAGAIPENKTARDTSVAVENVLSSFRKGQWFASVGLIAQYDSNISEVPGGSSIESQASYRATSQMVLSAGAGYMSPAEATIQWVPTYQFGYNYNFNSNTKEYEYGSNVATLYVNYKPLALVTGGLKLEGNFTFQNTPEDPTQLSGAYSLSKYSLAGDLGPYFKAQLSPWLRLEGELGVQPQVYYTETDLSGTAGYAKLTLRSETWSAFLDPGVSVGFSNDSTDGDEYKYRSGEASLFDVMRISLRDTLILFLDYTYYDYYATSPWRRDVTINPHLSALHLLSPQWSLIADLGYTSNTSTIPDTFSYGRFVGGAGASYSF